MTAARLSGCSVSVAPPPPPGAALTGWPDHDQTAGSLRSRPREPQPLVPG